MMTGVIVRFRYRRTLVAKPIETLTDEEFEWLRADLDMERLADIAIILGVWIRDHVHPVPIGVRGEELDV